MACDTVCFSPYTLYNKLVKIYTLASLSLSSVVNDILFFEDSLPSSLNLSIFLNNS